MILPFSTKLNSKPTYFPEKIWQSFTDEFTIDNFPNFENEYYEFHEDAVEFIPKLHTIREDKNNRWKAGNKIDFFINCRQKDMFRFAPVLPVVSVQKIEIEITENCGLIKRQVFIDGCNQIYYEYDDRVIDKGMLKLAQNDGFDTIDDFFAYFDKGFNGKIIHWTDLRY